MWRAIGGRLFVLLLPAQTKTPPPKGDGVLFDRDT
jgi:hypothetical protein